mmetsp:Transcript_141535/g.439989  ORF Transcript_141535/g.439989 Transcript_141535/m.439989 type:complete len:372 (-) Transcript_141535:127-1242(-)|eukprot:CAMPEP_0204524192 /NCGR_PEP_ID=MMETSP0661-20131031/7243_1 /ASSEMBLY_ACC=CAM_ASM_000606 /TAXON_ID=109239 /ORGANISM="Alexandrium margalefi, Strain AMGDE01CS-322" /LENGTH=371 /DNA_ID=CAMNT_0051529929 /DNA_START=21 /DNA_END=1136 /DNA_ORIENTATION=-
MPEDAPASEPQAKRARVADDEAKVTPAALEQRLQETTLYAKLPEGGLAGFISTHHGTFHADEAMACAMLKCLPEYASMPILRTRNQAEIDKASIVVDVGATYEPEKHRYDHHQKSFTDTYSEKYAGIKLSSAGLVFKHFGASVVRALCGPIEAKAAQAILAKTYDSLIRELDAQDNGVPVAEEPRYRFCTHLGARIGRLNPGWQEPSSPEMENTRFKEAMKLAAKELCDVICGYCNGWLPARTIVEEALAKRSEVHPSGEVMKLPRFCPWQEHLFDLEEEAAGSSDAPLTKYVVFQDSRAGWRVQAAPKARGSFENRLPLPKAWCGVRDQQLSELSGIAGCVFVHAAGFIGGNETEAGALEMASKALTLAA